MNPTSAHAARHNDAVSADHPRGRPGFVNVAHEAGDPADPHVLTLDPIPGAPRVAREWVARKLVGWPAPGVENASLVVSELVTNAVLHAGTPIELRCVLDSFHVRLEVRDERADAPMLKAHASDASTGRGLRLVATLADEWGVSTADDAKVVWCVIGAHPGPSRLAQARRFARAVPLPGDGDPEPSGPGRASSGDGARVGGDDRSVRVAMLNLPLGMYDELGEHAEAVVRELALVAQSAAGRSGADAPEGLLVLAEGVRADFAPATRALRAQVERARGAGAETVDLELDVPAELLETLVALADRFDALDRHCEAGDLLTLASSPAQRRFRRWFADQLARQAGGLPPSPWAHGD